MPAGTERGQGDALRFRTPAGHAMELFYEFERCQPREPSLLLNQPERYPAAGVGVRRLDHINLTAADVNPRATGSPASSDSTSARPLATRTGRTSASGCR